MSQRLSFAVPGDVLKALGPNVAASLHWAEKGRRVVSWKTRARLMWQQAGSVHFAGPVRITYTIRRSRRADIDNCQAATKALTDGLRGPGLMIPDDGPEWLTEVLTRLETGAEWKGREEVLVTVEETEE